MLDANTRLEWERFPGYEIVSAGLADVEAGRVTPAACGIAIIWPRLRRAGVTDPAGTIGRISLPEHTLYRLMQREGGDAYGRYNGMIRRLVSFEHALDHASTTPGISPTVVVRP